jgi:small subunit ribosomal protein S8e
LKASRFRLAHSSRREITMVQYHATRLSKTTGSGGKLKQSADKKRAHIGGFFARTKVIRPDDARPGAEPAEVRKTFRSKGGSKKLALDYALFANVTGPDGKTTKMRIINVLENRADRMYSRENVITRGSIIQVEAGRARVTSRPGQDGVANAVMLRQ